MGNNNFYRKFAAGAALAGLLLTAGAAAADGPAFTALWSARAPLVNRSTEALATGHHVRAARFAALARAVATHDADRLIAVQNLCLALMAQGKADVADASCRAAISSAGALAPESDKIVFARGALTTGADERNRPALSLSAAVRDNIARAYGAQVVDHMTDDLASAW